MKLVVKSLFIFGLVGIAIQGADVKKKCDCSACKTHSVLFGPGTGPAKSKNSTQSGCNLCERRKQLLRMEKEKEQQLNKCPFEILGSPSLKGKTSEEIFDEFRELIVPSQNGIFDLMRGIVKTMHVTSESELKWAKEKEAKMMAEKGAKNGNRGSIAKRERDENAASVAIAPMLLADFFQRPKERFALENAKRSPFDATEHFENRHRLKVAQGNPA